METLYSPGLSCAFLCAVCLAHLCARSVPRISACVYLLHFCVQPISYISRPQISSTFPREDYLLHFRARSVSVFVRAAYLLHFRSLHFRARPTSFQFCAQSASSISAPILTRVFLRSVCLSICMRCLARDFLRAAYLQYFCARPSSCTSARILSRTFLSAARFLHRSFFRAFLRICIARRMLWACHARGLRRAFLCSACLLHFCAHLVRTFLRSSRPLHFRVRPT